MNKLNKREQYLIIAAGCIIIIAAYFMFRVQPMHNELTELQQQKKKAQRKLNKEKQSQKKLGSANSLKKEVADLKKKIEVESKTMAGYQQAFLDLQENEKQADLRAAITRLIENEQIIILESAESNHSLDTIIALNQSNKAASGTEIKRPLIDFKLAGDYVKINAFIQKIKELPYSVVITKLNLTVERKQNMRQPYQLLTELTLAI